MLQLGDQGRPLDECIWAETLNFSLGCWDKKIAFVTYVQVPQSSFLLAWETSEKLLPLPPLTALKPAGFTAHMPVCAFWTPSGVRAQVPLIFLSLAPYSRFSYKITFD